MLWVELINNKAFGWGTVRLEHFHFSSPVGNFRNAFIMKWLTFEHCPRDPRSFFISSNSLTLPCSPFIGSIANLLAALIRCVLCGLIIICACLDAYIVLCIWFDLRRDTCITWCLILSVLHMSAICRVLWLFNPSQWRDQQQHMISSKLIIGGVLCNDGIWPTP